MLQLKQISKVLSTALTTTPNSTSASSPLALSLLSHSGLPLTTVTQPDLENVEYLSVDNLKIYSLLAVNFFKHQSLSGALSENSWAAVELDKNLNVIIEKLDIQDGSQNTDESSAEEPVPELELYVVLFYTKDFSAAVAKVKLDAVAPLLSEGLKGYYRG